MGLASVAWNEEFVNITGRKIRKSWQNLVETSAFFLVEIYHILIKSSRDSHHHSYTLILFEINRTRRDCQLESSRAYIIIFTHIYLTYVRDSCILDVYTSRYTYIMHKRVYTVTLDIECWDDLKVEKIDWAKSINLFPDEFIHSSVQELSLPRPVDRTWSGTIEVDGNHWLW